MFSWVQCCLRAISQTRFSCLAVIGNRWESFLAGAEDFAGEGEEGAGFVVPLDDAFQAPGGFLGLVLGHLLEQGFEVHEALVGGVQAGLEALADKAGDEGLEHVRGTIITGGAFAVLPVAFDGTEFFEGAKALEKMPMTLRLWMQSQEKNRTHGSLQSAALGWPPMGVNKKYVFV